MANSILTSHYSGTSNTILVSHGWPDGSSANSVLGSHDADYPASGDTTPDAFSFTDQTDVAVNTTRTSNTITVAGITAAASISITGGTYQIGAGSFTSASGTVTNGQTVTVRHTSSVSNSTATNTVLTIGGVSDTFTSTTVAASGFSAVLNTGTGELVITGVGFGTKSTPAPLFFQPFVGLTNGLLPTHASVGFDGGADGYGYPQTSDADGIGGGCLTMPVLGATNSDDDWFFHLGVILDANQSELFVSQWQKFAYTSGTLAQAMQIKGIRAGRVNPGTPTVEGSYGYHPSMGGSLWIQTDGSQTTDGNNCYQWFRETGNTTEIGNFEQWHDSEVAPYRTPNDDLGAGAYPRVTTAWGQWFQQEVYFKMNDYGATNGEQMLIGNGAQLVHLTHANPRISTDADNAFQWVGLWPGIDHTLGADLHARISRVYIDNTRKRVFLGNASTLGACTGRFLLPPTEWADTLIKCSNCTNIPSGYNWVYVLDENDAEIDSGAYT